MKRIILKTLTLGIFITGCMNTTSKTSRYIKDTSNNEQEFAVEHSSKFCYPKISKTNKSYLGFKTLNVLGTLVTTYLLSSLFPSQVNSLEIDTINNFNYDFINSNILYNKHKSRNLLADHEEVFLKKYFIDTPIFDLFINSYPNINLDSCCSFLFEDLYTDLTIFNDSSLAVSESRNIILPGPTEGLNISPSYIMKMTKNGIKEWAKYIYLEERDEFIQIKRNVKTSNEDIVIAGDSSEGIVLGKIKSSNGAIVWLKEITGDINYKTQDLINTNDGKFAFLGFNGSLSLISKFNVNGDIEWSTQHISTLDDFFIEQIVPRTLIQLTDDCYITGGSPLSGFFSKYYENGTYAYTKEISIEGTDDTHTLIKIFPTDSLPQLVALRDAKFALTGTSDYFFNEGLGTLNPFVTLLDSSGEVEWFKILNISSNNTDFAIFPFSIALTKAPNNEFILSMTNVDFPFFTKRRRRIMSSEFLQDSKQYFQKKSNNRRKLLVSGTQIFAITNLNTIDFASYIKFNTTCDIIFSKFIPKEKKITQLLALATTSDSDTVMFGFNSSFNERFLLKADPNGEIGECVEDYFLESIYLNASTENIEIFLNDTELITENITAGAYPLNISCTLDPCVPTSSPTNFPTEDPADFPTYSPSDRPTIISTNLATTENPIELPTITTPQPTRSEEPTIQSDKGESGTTGNEFSEIGLGIVIGLSVILLIFIILCIIYCIPYIKNPVI